MILARVPTLRVVCEHVTSAVGAGFVESQGDNVAATITAHHLTYNRNALFKGGVNPHFYCLPILKTELDRLKLIECAIWNPKFFLGTDSAPHAVGSKECCVGCAGCFTAHMAVELVAEVFEAAGHLDAVEDFVSRRGAAFYGLPCPEGHRTLVKEEWEIPETYPFGPTTVRPLRGGGKARWKMLPRDGSGRKRKQ